MMGTGLQPDALIQLADLLSHRLGLHYPARKHAELAHKVARLSRSIGFPDAAACLAWLISASDHAEITKRLISVCTVGETYFFREPDALNWFTQDGLPPLLAASRAEGRPLRIWSAGCCTGEEPYSLSMILRDSFPTLGRFDYEVYGTDVNNEFIARARAARYGPWSFRSVADARRARHFTRTDKEYTLEEAVRKRVTFDVLNLAAARWPDRYLIPGYFDAIFCRNVLMYFTEATMRHALQRFRASLRPGGCAVVSATESSILNLGDFRQHTGVPYVGMAESEASEYTPPMEPSFLARGPKPSSSLPDFWETKTAAVSRDTPDEAAVVDTPVAPRAQDVGTDAVATLEAAGRLEEACVALSQSPNLEEDAALQLRYARLCHLTGEDETAALWCMRALEKDALNAVGYNLLASIQREIGQTEEALTALQRALYLDPDSAAVHFQLGFVFRELGRLKPSRIHFRNASALLSSEVPETIITALGDLSAGRLAEIADTMARTGETS